MYKRLWRFQKITHVRCEGATASFMTTNNWTDCEEMYVKDYNVYYTLGSPCPPEWGGVVWLLTHFECVRRAARTTSVRTRTPLTDTLLFIIELLSLFNVEGFLYRFLTLAWHIILTLWMWPWVWRWFLISCRCCVFDESHSKQTCLHGILGQVL